MKTLLVKELMEQWRTHKLLLILIIFSIFGILSPLAARFMPEIVQNMTREQNIDIIIPDPLWTDAMQQYLKNISQMCSFILIIMTMGVVSKEKEKGTLIFLFVKPVKRYFYILSKFSVQFVSSLVAMISAGILCAFYIMLFFDDFDLLVFLKINLIIYLFVVIIQSITLFFSTLFKSSVMAGLLSFLAWLVMGLISQFTEIGKYSPSRLLEEANLAIMGMDLNWQAFAGSFVVFVLLISISIWFCNNWDTE